MYNGETHLENHVRNIPVTANWMGRVSSTYLPRCMLTCFQNFPLFKVGSLWNLEVHCATADNPIHNTGQVLTLDERGAATTSHQSCTSLRGLSAKAENKSAVACASFEHSSVGTSRNDCGQGQGHDDIPTYLTTYEPMPTLL